MEGIMTVLIGLWLLSLIDRVCPVKQPKAKGPPRGMTAHERRVFLPFFIDLAAKRGDETMVAIYRAWLSDAHKASPALIQEKETT